VARVRIFMSFDLSYDEDLKERLIAESLNSLSGFDIVGCSEPAQLTDSWRERVRHRIGLADEVIFICGEHTGESVQVSAEIGIAQEERKPYFLLWGRREVMCTKPVGARPGEGIYSWTSSILRDQMAVTLRLAWSREIPERYKRP